VIDKSLKDRSNVGYSAGRNLEDFRPTDSKMLILNSSIYAQIFWLVSVFAALLWTATGLLAVFDCQLKFSSLSSALSAKQPHSERQTQSENCADTLTYRHAGISKYIICVMA